MSISFTDNVLTVNFEELKGSPEERITSAWAGDGATRRLQCFARDRILLERELLGYIEYRGNDALMHLPVPFGDDRPGLVATSVVIKPFGRIGGSEWDTRFATYKYAILNVTFEVATRIPSNRYGFITLSEEVRDVTEFVTLPSKGLYWGKAESKEAIDPADAPAKINYGLEWIYTISGAYRAPPQIFTYVGKVNSVDIPIGYVGTGEVFARGTLLYVEPVVARELTFNGVIYRITLRFLHKDNGDSTTPKGWNYYAHVSEAGTTISYERITDGTNDKNFYPFADFRDVFV